jgi:hypothetical protein
LTKPPARFLPVCEVIFERVGGGACHEKKTISESPPSENPEKKPKPRNRIPIFTIDKNPVIAYFPK